jgi:hypothetical protein
MKFGDTKMGEKKSLNSLTAYCWQKKNYLISLCIILYMQYLLWNKYQNSTFAIDIIHKNYCHDLEVTKCNQYVLYETHFNNFLLVNILKCTISSGTLKPFICLWKHYL